MTAKDVESLAFSKDVGATKETMKMLGLPDDWSDVKSKHGDALAVLNKGQLLELALAKIREVEDLRRQYESDGDTENGEDNHGEGRGVSIRAASPGAENACYSVEVKLPTQQQPH